MKKAETFSAAHTLQSRKFCLFVWAEGIGRSKGAAPLNLGTRCRWEVCLTHPAALPQEISPHYVRSERLTGPQYQFGRFWKRGLFVAPARQRTPVYLAQSLVQPSISLTLARNTCSLACLWLTRNFMSKCCVLLRQTVECRMTTECSTAVTVHLYTLTVSVVHGWGDGCGMAAGRFSFIISLPLS